MDDANTGRGRLRRSLTWIAGNLAVCVLSGMYLLATVDWFLSPALEPWIRTWPQAVAVLIVTMTPTTMLGGLLLLGRRGSGRASRRVAVLLTVFAVLNLGFAIRVVVDGSRSAPDIDHDVEVEIPDARAGSR